MEGKKSSIQVEVRINPRSDSVIENTTTTLTVGTKTYTFNKVHLTTSQVMLYNKSVKHLTEYFVEGYNCAVIAYGQTGSGKTYTMGMTHEDTTGVVPQALRHIFKKCSEVSCSFIEVYNEEVIDLFSSHKTPLNLREVHGEITVAGVSEMVLKSYEEGLEALRKGSLERTTKFTNMNSKSSRSHAIFTVFHKAEVNDLFMTSKFSFVDLAGSERLKRTLCAGDRVREGISINSGLLALGNVISALFKGSPHVPFRDSKLTRILQSCLNGYVLMIACVSSSYADISETHNTLKYANRAACIETKVKMNVQVDSSKFAMLMLKKEIQKLKTENQMLKERFRKSTSIDMDELMYENRMLKSEIETLKSRSDGGRENITQEMLKVPFVQNLVNENSRLKEEVLHLKRLEDFSRPDSSSSSDSSVFRTQKLFNRMENGDIIKDELDDMEGFVEISTKDDRSHSDGEGKEIETDGGGISPMAAISKYVDSLEISDTRVVDVKENGPAEGHRRMVTFDLQGDKKRYALFTPRKEKIKMKTGVERRLKGYVPTALTLFNSSVVFASIDNKVRQWGEELSVLFSEDGVRCLEAGENLMYSARGVLKSFDHRYGTRPLHAFRSEISAFICRDECVYTGHEDGSLCVFDIRKGSIVASEKIHSGTVFCIEKIGDRIYSGSRDHTISCYSDGFSILSPPHLDSVQGLVRYKGELISVGRDSSLKRWRDGCIVKTVPYAHDSWIKCCGAMDDWFLSGSKDGTLRFWDFCGDSVFCVGKMKMDGSINSIVCGEGSLYVGSQNKEIVEIKCRYD